MLWLLLIIPIVGSFLLVQGKARSLKRMEGETEQKILIRLQGVASRLSGKVVAGPALETPAGKLMIYASKAPKVTTIDVTKFSAAVPGSASLTVVRVEDEKKVPVKGLQPMAPPGFAGSEQYRVFGSDLGLAARVFTPAFVEKLRALEAAARGRVRLQLNRGQATLTLSRGLEQPAELADFHQNSAAVIEEMKAAG